MQIAKYNFQQSLNIKDNNITKEYVKIKNIYSKGKLLF